MRSVAVKVAVLGLAALGWAAVPTPASAHWQYTQWGMSPDAVRAASEGIARDNSDRGLDAADVRAVLTAPFQGVSLPFTAVFLFDRSERLQVVTLKPVGQIACPVLVDTLKANYGPPEGKADMVHATTMRWDDTGNDNLVVYLDLGHGDCTVQYSRLPPTRPDGKNL